MEQIKKNQSSVEWLFQQVWINPVSKLPEILEQAKAMHKEEQATTWLDSRLEDKGDNYIGKQKSFEQYYNETFGGNNESN